jgi:hypothetical protein
MGFCTVLKFGQCNRHIRSNHAGNDVDVVGIRQLVEALNYNAWIELIVCFDDLHLRPSLLP